MEVLTSHEEKVNAERKSTAPASRVQLESVPTVYDNLASHLPPTDGIEAQHELVAAHSEPEQAAADCGVRSFLSLFVRSVHAYH